MKIYLISNNLVLNDITYETEMALDLKRATRPLAIEGEKAAFKLAQKLPVEFLYSSAYASALATAKYFSEASGINININHHLDDAKIGSMGRHNIKMLRFMQERNFDYKYPSGESLNETKLRVSKAFGDILKNNRDTAVVTHKRTIMALLLKYCTTGYNLNERLILSYNDKVILDDSENDIDVLVLTIEDGKIMDIDNLEE